ncbi:protein-S-isoprenylcysteine methyltransferase [Sphingobium sp. SCG-1]|uniref:methyltransferase family protein n=1 Tax=Sphingobium sp. SCG-1 TaxID=2072936 RepID=UPI000CD69E05|nr:isoprenylcysteine carboxylmethyltransferase family protein [Sphingobium sp. SCG-1]AUW57604.1 protein-S-isoprenylcysteine methyltransferase [Sphingobium sp. SCG-1]
MHDSSLPDLDPCPPSAVSHGVGVAGLFGLIAWVALAWHYGMDGPYAGMAAIFACGVPMVLWSLLVDRVHRNASTGIDWEGPPKALRDIFDISLVKLTGFWATWGIMAVLYCLARWYWDGGYRFAMEMFGTAAPWLLVASVPYVLWLDRRLIEPRDASYAFGQWIIGGAAGMADLTQVAHHARAWLVKGFFLAFMLSVLPSNFANLIHWNLGDVLASPIGLANFLIMLLFLIDVAFATVGYMLTCKPLDAHIRTANPLLAGWVAALMCYPPFVLMGDGGPLDYHHGTAEWSYWLGGNQPALVAIQWIYGSLLVALTGIYAWATVAFGLRFSNLTHRGIITHGPYRWTRHPAYLSKNLFWWLSALPFLVTTGSLVDVVRNSATIAIVSAIYFWRAKTEEAHLNSDPAYAAYSQWMQRHGWMDRLLAALKGKPPSPTMQPAE